MRYGNCMSIRDELVALGQSGRYCTLERSFSEGARYYGYVVCVWGEHVVLEKFHDFFHDGISVFRIDQITGVSATESSEFFERVIESEGLRRELPPPEALASLCALLSWACQTGEVVIAEEESDAEEDSFYWLGRITDIDDTFAELVCLDSKGHWDPEPLDIEIEELTHFQVGSRYSEMFAKYCDPFPLVQDIKE